jgi:hypothetical protein
MKTRFLFLLLLISAYSFSQSVNDYKGVIVPLKFDFLKSENQYRLSTLTKFNLQKAGFTAFYTNESIPSEYNDRCGLLYADVKKENAFLTTKLYVVFKDCKGAVVFQSAVGKSNEKDYQVAYTDALVDTFKSVFALNYKYNGAAISNNVEVVPTQSPMIASVPAVVDAKDLNILYAQPTASGFQLVDSTPKVIMKLLRTSRNDTFIATKEGVQGVLIAKANQWFFEYYQNNQLVSEQIGVKF